MHSKLNHALIIEVYSRADATAEALVGDLVWLGQVAFELLDEFVGLLKVELCHLEVVLAFEQTAHVRVESTL